MDEKRAAILATLQAIPPGHVTSYGEVARRAGLSGYQRFVCRVLRELPDRTTTPWWRVLRSNGQLAMDSGSVSGREQRQRLASEGVVITNDRARGPWWN